MSFFLLEENQAEKIILLRYKQSINGILAEDPKPQQQKTWVSSKSEIKGGLWSQKVLRQNQSCKQYTFLIKNMNQKHRLVAKMVIGKRNSDICVSLQILCESGLFLKVNKLESLSQLSIKVNQYVNNTYFWAIKICFNIHNGSIAIKIPLYYNLSHFINILKGQQVCQFIFKNYVQQYISIVQFVIKEVTNQSSLKYSDNTVKILENIYRYSRMMHINSHLNQSRFQTQQQTATKQKNKRVSIKKAIDNIIPIDDCLIKNTTQLFQNQCLLNNLLPRVEKDYLLQDAQIKYIRSLVIMPMQPKPKNPFQNLMILNHICVHDIANIKLNPINNGGFSTIYLSEIKFSYVYSTEEHQMLHPVKEEQSAKKLINKFVIIKKEDQNATYCRNMHEINILKKIKNGSSIFLSKYYIISNKINPFHDTVVMDFIPSKTLKDYLYFNIRSISLLTKLYLIFSIVQSLRYIRDYRIVHLDLKSNNIMMYCNMLIKLIDFGESFHPDICLKKYKPGYTIPYSPPEVFKRKLQQISVKSDIFSLGIIIFQMLYNTFPFDIFDSSAHSIDQIMEHYLERWYFVPQQYEAHGDITTLRILNGIISKCLSSNPADRPQLDWIALIIRSCFQLLQ